ncbi:MAG: thiamine-phosphate kinase [Thermoplasmata archaeon]|nr:thiamine-phosphate kinase [Thermoplasmata archaeon]
MSSSGRSTSRTSRARARPSRRSRTARFEEREFHAWLRREPEGGRGLLLPLGDDAAALPSPRKGALLLTTDAFAEGFHFFPDSPPRALGRALVAVNASDLAAKGGHPIAFLLDLLVPPGTPANWSHEVVRGVRAELRRLGAPLAGGDSKPSVSKVLVGTFLGRASSSHLAPRSGARAGDLLLLTGSVGGTGWAARKMGQASRAARVRLHQEFLRITPRLAAGRVLVRHAHAMLDTSDGFAEAAILLSEASQKRILIQADRLPLDPRLRRARLPEAERLRLAAYGGEYELLAALPPRAPPVVRRALARVRGPFAIVGGVEEGRGAWLLRGARREPLPVSGWRPWD